MPETKRKKQALKTILIVLSAIFLIVVVIGYKVYHDIYFEEYCYQVALKAVGDKGWTSKLVADPPWINDSNFSSKTIYIGFYKQLECEHNAKAFILF